MPDIDPIYKVTILARGRTGGHAMSVPEDDKGLMTRSEMIARLVFAMGGRAAEELVFREPTTGAVSDIEQATKIARAMVTEYGMSSKLGAVRYGTEHGDPFLGRTMGTQADYSHEVAQIIDDEVRKLIEAAHTEAWEILTEYRDVLDTLAGELLEKETLHRAELQAIFGDVKKRPRLTMFDDFGGRIPSDKPPIKTPGELAIERGEEWPKPVPEPAFKAAIAKAAADAPKRRSRTARMVQVPTEARTARRSPTTAPRPVGTRRAGRRSHRQGSTRRPASGTRRRRHRSQPAGSRLIRRISPIRTPARSSNPAGRPVGPLPTTRMRARNRTGLTRRPTADTNGGLNDAGAQQLGDVLHPGVRPTARRSGDPGTPHRGRGGPEPARLGGHPARVARAYKEMFAGLYTDPDTVLDTTFDEQHDELVLVKQIPLYSTCEHHLVAFHGVAHVGYIPGVDGRVTGLSKIARLVDLYAKRPQVQERLTAQIADALMRKLEPRGAIVIIEAEHLCMSMRGVRKPGATTTTSAVRGQFKVDAASRSEALDLILRK